MLRIIIPILLLAFHSAKSQITSIPNEYSEKDTVYRDYNDSSGKYLVAYEYDLFGMVMIPATNPPGAPHYDAIITVYKLIKCRCIDERYDTILVGQPFHGAPM